MKRVDPQDLFFLLLACFIILIAAALTAAACKLTLTYLLS